MSSRYYSIRATRLGLPVVTLCRASDHNKKAAPITSIHRFKACLDILINHSDEVYPSKYLERQDQELWDAIHKVHTTTHSQAPPEVTPQPDSQAAVITTQVAAL
ncbi:hypothetical protein DSO57_1018692 [Entomophthora muscae]|uniref:Uncharacterized protein n=1 Tax=Entomophthora muscae TaxID=34485 RepID=A0ACC2UDI3_9FUNG|nr:hypothetical protein DSO57_1018692 [Entomophthora muscae]